MNLYNPTLKIIAWSVHLLTASGLVAAFMALIAVSNEDWRQSFLWLFLCFLIDGVDGFLARKFNVIEVLPFMDGKTIDFVVDFVAYLVVPAFFFYKADMVTSSMMIPALIIILVSSALYYGKKEMVKDNLYFIGFPVLWNIVVFFLFFVFDNNPTLNFLAVVFFGILHFVPIRFAYVTRHKHLFWPHAVFSTIGLLAALVIIYRYPTRSVLAEIGTYIAIAYFSVIAAYDTLFK